MAMSEYMKKRAAQMMQPNSEDPSKVPMTNGIPNSALLSVFEGKTKATSQMMGHKENLAPSVAAKMSQAFGMNFMDMQVYRSDAMKGTGMQGLTQGNKVILSSDIDLNTTRGQAVLGHEFSHVHAQSQGIGMGHSGLYENASLEAQADREGLLAAQGRPIYGDVENPGMSYGLGMAGVEGLTPIGGGMSASAGAPMQASKKKDKATPEEAMQQKIKFDEMFGNSEDFFGESEGEGDEIDKKWDELEKNKEIWNNRVKNSNPHGPEEPKPEKPKKRKYTEKELSEINWHNNTLKMVKENRLPDYMDRDETIKLLKETARKYVPGYKG